MDKNPLPKIYGVLGYPAKHSLSPSMHNAAFTALKINSRYKIFEIRPEELEDFFHSLSKENIFGLNVTIPYKEKVLEYLQWESPEVRFTRAANTIIVKDKNYLEGWNTDGIGFHLHLTQDLKFNPSGKIVTVLGAGGAAKAITNQLARSRVKIIYLYDIDQNRCLSLAEKINKEFPDCKTIPVNSIDELDIKNSDLLINATPIGMKENDPLLIGIDKLHSGLLVYDLIYNPPETKLIKIAKEKRASVSNGLGMLLYQGAHSFELWTDNKAPIEIMRQALNEGVKK